MRRRLPIYLLIERSVNEEILQEVEKEIQAMIADFKRTPIWLEITHFSVITFAKKVKEKLPLTYLMDFSLPKLKSKNKPSHLGNALLFLAEKISKDVNRVNREDCRADYKPLVFIFATGKSVDDLEEGIAALQKQDIQTIMAFAPDSQMEKKNLKKITTNITVLQKVREAVRLYNFHVMVQGSRGIFDSEQKPFQLDGSYS